MNGLCIIYPNLCTALRDNRTSSSSSAQRPLPRHAIDLEKTGNHADDEEEGQSKDARERMAWSKSSSEVSRALRLINRRVAEFSGDKPADGSVVPKMRGGNIRPKSAAAKETPRSSKSSSMSKYAAGDESKSNGAPADDEYEITL